MEHPLPLRDDVRTAIKDYLKLDDVRQRNLHSNGEEADRLQPSDNSRTLDFEKLILTREVNNIVAR